MKRLVIRAALSTLVVFASAAAMAQDEAGPSTLDLSVPAERIHFASTGGNPDRSDPPGAWQPITPAQAEASIARDWQVHGAVEAGIGWSRRTGNSNWQAANINLDKTYTDEDGDTKHFNIDINVGQSEGAPFGPGAFYGPGYGPGYYGVPGYDGPAPGPMHTRGPLVR